MSITTSIKGWLSEFLFTREHFKGPISTKPLYSYQVSSEEYQQLETILRFDKRLALDPVKGGHWAAGYCLFVAEWYRREYNSVWSWEELESRVGCEFTSTQRGYLLENGLEGFWKRHIRQREHGRDLLGSLFAEGGLPWQLVQSSHHGFGRIVKKGLRNHYRTAQGLRTTLDIINTSDHGLPQAFTNMETMQILAGIVDQLMFLAEKYAIREQANPVALLDEKEPGWRSAFPVPLDQSNAQSLINEWLKDAGERQREHKQRLEDALAFTTQHKLVGTLPNWSIVSELILPENTTLPKLENLTTTRLELGFYEGDRLIAKGGTVYLQNDGSNLKIRFPEQHINLKRNNIEAPVLLKLLENGRPVHIFSFDSSSIDYNHAPLIFEQKEDDWYLAAQASCHLNTGQVRVRLPQGALIVSGNAEGLSDTEERWYQGTEDLLIKQASDVYRIRLNQLQDATLLPSLSGKISLYESRSNTVFVGFPKLNLPEGYKYSHVQLHHWVNGQRISQTHQYTNAGIVRYQVKNEQGETLLQRKISTLPEGFYISAFPAIGDQPAKLRIYNGEGLLIQVLDEQVRSHEEKTSNGHYLYLNHTSETIPAKLRIEVSSNKSIEPVELIIPYPYQGARLISDDKPVSKTDLTLDDLLGMQLQLFSGQTRIQDFHISLQLIGPYSRRESDAKLVRNFSYKVGIEPHVLSLFSFQSEIQRLLGSVDNQDAFVRLTLSSNQPLLHLNIRRYSGVVEKQGSDKLSVYGLNRQLINELLDVQAMLLSDPKQKPVSLVALTSQGVPTGEYILPEVMNKAGTWLIYPRPESPIQFRPALHVAANAEEPDYSAEAMSLHQATELYHPRFNMGVIDQQIEAMANNLQHSGWQYLLDIKTEFNHLPLSVFETWQALARNPKALAVSIFRMHMDEAFCNRVRDELAIIWESISLFLWRDAYSGMRSWYQQLGTPEGYVDGLMSSHRTILLHVVSGFVHLGQYIETGCPENKNTVPPEIVLPMWYQELRQNHDLDNRWPTELGVELRAWIQRQNLPDTIKLLSNTGFTHAVTLLPVFMAYVTAGRESMESLHSDPGFLKFSIRVASDFNRCDWYEPAHALMVSYLLTADV
ncbi:hypothetical protein E1189_03875 [Sansalvadorimonas verongulae]|nr:hypothetical protein [Sansalvadorimonas verongulae]